MTNKNILITVVMGVSFLIAGYFLGNKNNIVTDNNVTASTTAENVVEKNSETKATEPSKVGVKKTTTLTNTSVSNYVKFGERILINGVYITPNDVTYDGRCITNTKCAQPGVVDVGVLLENASLNQSLIMTSGKPVGFTGKQVTLVSALPVRVSSKPIAKSDYKFLFVVTTRQ